MKFDLKITAKLRNVLDTTLLMLLIILDLRWIRLVVGVDSFN